MRILLVEDNSDLAASVSEYLEMKDCSCDVAFNGKAGLNLATLNEYDAYVFDIAMPEMDGLALCQALRNTYADPTPVLFLTARDSIDDKTIGYSVGADDYLIKPFELKELLLRLQAIYKRSVRTETVLQIRDLKVNTKTQRVERDGCNISLPPYTYRLLLALMQRSPELVSREQLEYLVWRDELPESDSLRSHLYKLRQLIDKPFSSPMIETVKGRGFRIS